MKVREILKAKGSSVVTARPTESVRALVRRFREERIGALVVVNDAGAPMGLVSERDVVYGLAIHGERILGMRADEVMDHALIGCAPDDGLRHVMTTMTERRLRHLPVLDQGKLAGIVSIGDVVKHRLDEMELETSVLRDRVIASR
jgi:CBS domain-containing protein